MVFHVITILESSEFGPVLMLSFQALQSNNFKDVLQGNLPLKCSN